MISSNLEDCIARLGYIHIITPVYKISSCLHLSLSPCMCRLREVRLSGRVLLMLLDHILVVVVVVDLFIRAM